MKFTTADVSLSKDVCDKWRGQGGLNLPLTVPFHPGSHPVFFGSRPLAFFRLQNIAQCCIIFPFFSCFPPPWESRFPPPLLPPPVHLLPPFLPVSRPPVPPPTDKAVKSALGRVNTHGISNLTRHQSKALLNFLCGKDSFVSLPTGHGKSLIYQLEQKITIGVKFYFWFERESMQRAT